MIIFIVIILVMVLVLYLFLQRTPFGKLPSGQRLERIKQSPNYKNGTFQNLSHTPNFTNGANYYTVLKKFFFEKKERRYPADIIPAVKTDLHRLNRHDDVLVWFGHSSYFMQVDGKRILVDPVLSGSASPLAYGTKAFKGADVYSTDDIPAIDYLFISHDHWDHLDYRTLKKLQPNINTIIGGLGVGAHLERWGFDPAIIHELDWNDTLSLEDGFTVHATPARHFSGRGLARNKALWLSFVLHTPAHKLFLGGDSGYDNHFAEIGRRFGEFDLAILENGQYDKSWSHIHLMPGEMLQAAKDLKAKRIFPVHSSKFALGNHAWDEPLNLVTHNNESANLAIITPMIGEAVNLKDNTQQFTQWWKKVK